MELFYTPPERIDLSSGALTVGDDEFFHIVKVLRKRVGERIRLTDGQGLSLAADIVAIGRHELTASIAGKEMVTAPSTRVTVAISLLKSAHRFDFFLEKAAELGVSAIVPMVTERTVSLPRAEKAARKIERWRKVLIAGLRQTGRFHLPDIREPRSFEEVLGMGGFDLKLVPYEASRRSPVSDFAGKNVLFAIGGEGGFSEREIGLAKESGFKEISLGRSILRAETAGMFAVAMVRAQLAATESQEEWL
ncbi:16S rRNA (uracil(1498)-N(3))-methyltransferase [Prosthecochloris sp. GSB1]|uniref:16S rRNA (uracil(1498)-N(3))-methyltransferase n=1 Tax=Prosthecochloris sp. GSB1 TaxID=281093 RepID=UPI000B8D0B70|nr:16S rRNA (uracil(1498)-N(3))-methyltransferase [Prosthecochloris sp. GSB1]ASQ91301.1 16S rRNA (uracil(1498)-N(3))-methyltransferase [Prosthecochloris sp. GSB1]